MSSSTYMSRVDWRSLARYDLPASLVVFLVALPPSLGIAAVARRQFSRVLSPPSSGNRGQAMGGSPLAGQ